MARPKKDPLHHEQLTNLTDAPNSPPSWDHEALIVKIQIIDSCTRREARRQVMEMAHSFIHRLEHPPTAPVYVRHRTDYPTLSLWLPRTNQHPLLEPRRI